MRHEISLVGEEESDLEDPTQFDLQRQRIEKSFKKIIDAVESDLQTVAGGASRAYGTPGVLGFQTDFAEGVRFVNYRPPNVLARRGERWDERGNDQHLTSW